MEGNEMFGELLDRLSEALREQAHAQDDANRLREQLREKLVRLQSLQDRLNEAESHIANLKQAAMKADPARIAEAIDMTNSKSAVGLCDADA